MSVRRTRGAWPGCGGLRPVGGWAETCCASMTSTHSSRPSMRCWAPVRKRPAGGRHPNHIRSGRSPADDRPAGAASTRWAGSMGLRLVLGAATGTQAALAGLPRGVVTGGVPGRGVILDGAATTACQIVLREKALSIRLRPRQRLRAAARAAADTAHLGGRSGRYLGCGRGRGCSGHASGSHQCPGDRAAGSGRSTALRALAQAIPSDALIVDDLDLADVATVTQVEAALARSMWCWPPPRRRRWPRPSAARSPPCVSAKRSSCCGPVCAMPIKPPASPCGRSPIRGR